MMPIDHYFDEYICLDGFVIYPLEYVVANELRKIFDSALEQNVTYLKLKFVYDGSILSPMAMPSVIDDYYGKIKVDFYDKDGNFDYTYL